MGSDTQFEGDRLAAQTLFASGATVTPGFGGVNRHHLLPRSLRGADASWRGDLTDVFPHRSQCFGETRDVIRDDRPSEEGAANETAIDRFRSSTRRLSSTRCCAAHALARAKRQCTSLRCSCSSTGSPMSRSPGPSVRSSSLSTAPATNDGSSFRSSVRRSESTPGDSSRTVSRREWRGPF